MIHIKSESQIEQMKAAGALSKAALRRAGAMVKPGVSTQEIDSVVEGFIRLHGAVPTFKGYGGFPVSICSSVNEQIVHGIPSPATILQEGDVISIDIPANAIELKIPQEEFDARMAAFVPKTKQLTGYLRRYAKLVGSGATGAVLDEEKA